MRFLGFLLLLASPLLSGCACFVADCGKDLRGLTKEDVHACLGDPVSCGIETEHPFECFQTKTMIRDNRFDSPGYPMVWIGTLGTVDLIYVPYEFYFKCRGMILGQMVRVDFDQDGKVVSFSFDPELPKPIDQPQPLSNEDQKAPTPAANQ